MTEIEMNSNQQEIFNKLTNNNKIVLQLFNEDGTYTTEYVKSINDIQKKLNIPYSTLINLYYICTNKGGGKQKHIKKKYIHCKYIELLKHIRIFDSINEHLITNNEFIKQILEK